ncbi:helix-turn-helix transcriptional regulator [Roseomonas sp. ROY-5-3]|uniref:Helix-turn-helix transcriptional regulator n=1 Tax=Falsiroseomonas oleicola TaxID=2801474 RepID=A0ABS6H4D9_9PROT|nr:helix-turn-helix transcriptional regulator [Roseomonas oleicola]
MDLAELAQRADAAAALLRTLANRTRIMIMCELALGERSVSDLAAMLELSQSALSQHLARLRQEKLVETRRAAHHIFYRIGDQSVRDIMTVLYHVYCRKVEAMAAEHGMQMRAAPMPGAAMPSAPMGGMPPAMGMPMQPMRMPMSAPMPDAAPPPPARKRAPRRGG